MKNKSFKLRNFSIDKWFANNGIYVLSFILPIISIIIVYILKEVYPFGEEMYLRSDCYHQYAPYFTILQDKLKEGGSLLYTWDIGGGMNFLAIAAYYLTSPFNLLIAYWPGHMADFIGFFIVIKMGLAGFSISYYLSKHFNQKSFSTVVFGMAYALSAYFVAFSWNIMWLDCMWLLPFIILGLEKLVNNGKCKMYCISLALAIFSNYYIGIMLCIFSVIYFIYLIIVSDFESPLGKIIARLTAFKDFVIYSLLAGGIAAIVILPEYYALLMTKSADTTFPEKLTEYFSVLYMLFRSLINIPIADLKYPHDPNIYCSMAMFILIPLFCLCKNIDAKKRWGKVTMAVILLLSFNLNIPNYIWHGFHFPNSLPCRESFIYIFLLITMAYEAFIHLKEYKASHIVGSAFGSVALILLLQELFPDATFFTEITIEITMTKIIYTSIFFIAMYLCLIFAYRKFDNLKAFIAYLMVLVVFLELTTNMNTTGIVSTSNRESYYESVPAYHQLEEFAENDAKKSDRTFYRSETKTHATRNDGARFNYNSISTFCSVASAPMQEFYSAMGLQTSFNAYSYLGHTPLTASMFSVLYEYSVGDASMPDYSTEISSANYKNAANAPATLNLYKNKNILPLGFMINSSTMANWDRTTGDPFDVQNGFVTNAVNGGKKIWKKLTNNSNNSFVASYENGSKSEENEMDVYFYCTTSATSLTATVSGSSNKSVSFRSTNQNYICHVGKVNVGDTINITAGDGQAISVLYAYAFNAEAWDHDYELLNQNTYKVDKFEDTYISGTIDVDSTGIMYTSIPYEEDGWTIYVDGKKAKPTGICGDALTGILLSPGKHKVEFKYIPAGLIPGAIISLICLLVFILLSIFKNKISSFIHSKIEFDPSKRRLQ